VWVLYRQELRSALRERNIVVYSILLPLLLYPLLMWAFFSAITFVKGETEGFVSRMAIDGLPAEHDALRATLTRDPKIAIVASDAPHDQVVADLRSGRLDLIADCEVVGPRDVSPPNLDVHVTYDASRDRSVAAKDRFVDALDRYRAEWLRRAGGGVGLTPGDLRGFAVTTVNVASAQNVGAFILKLMLPTLLVAMVALGCFYPAVDSTAGERERSTWETTMTLAADRSSVVVAKYLYVVTLGVVAALLNIAAMVLTMGPLVRSLGAGGESVSFSIPLAAFPIVALGAVLVALFVAAGMMICAAFARTFREGQTMVSPFYLLTILPVTFLQQPDLAFTPGFALVPLINVALMFRDAIGGVFQWPLIVITVSVEALTIVACLALAQRVLAFEEVLMGSYNGSVMKFVRERLLGRGAKERTA
jgi:sodium transport system permease protein